MYIYQVTLILLSKYSIFEKICLNYLNGIFINPPKFDSNIFKNNVLIGNSSSFTNNHIEIIDMISKNLILMVILYFHLFMGEIKDIETSLSNMRKRNLVIIYFS